MIPIIKENRARKLENLTRLLKVSLKSYDIINVALTHPSYVFEKDGMDLVHNQRLEFLGDAVVDLIVGEYLYKTFRHKTEGELTKMRAALVCESSLANAARRLHLGDYLLIGKGERSCGGADRASNLADAWESMVGALYLELGIDAVRNIVIDYIQPEISMVKKGYYGDYKTQLQEFIQKNPEDQVNYKILSEKGPDHDKDFVAGVYVNDELQSKGQGKTKKEAEQNAACAALIKLGEIDG